MDMHIFQIKSNQTLPSPGGILIASPLLNDYHFMRSVVLLITHSEEGSMGIVMNKDFRYHISLNQLARNWKVLLTFLSLKEVPWNGIQSFSSIH